MASTEDMAPEKEEKPAASRRGRARITERSSEEQLYEEIERLQADVQSLMGALGRVGNEKVDQARRGAKTEYRHLVEAGQQAVSAAQDEFGEVERQIKDTIRQRPLTAVLTAAGIGFLVAILTR